MTYSPSVNGLPIWPQHRRHGKLEAKYYCAHRAALRRACFEHGDLIDEANSNVRQKFHAA
jgi:hypothetical protein